MRPIFLTMLFATSFSFASAQSRWAMIGEYRYSIFMYSYKLTLIDSENYEIEESSDRGTEKIIGTWTIRGQAIRLTAKTKITTSANGTREEMKMIQPKEDVVVIESKNSLAPVGSNFKLERVK